MYGYGSIPGLGARQEKPLFGSTSSICWRFSLQRVYIPSLQSQAGRFQKCPLYELSMLNNVGDRSAKQHS